jgi:hypothetical protein
VLLAALRPGERIVGFKEQVGRSSRAKRIDLRSGCTRGSG